MDEMVPLESLPEQARRLIRPGTPAFMNYATQYEKDNKLPKGSIAHAKFTLKEGSDPLSVFKGVALMAPHTTLKPLTADPTDGMSMTDKFLAGAGKSAHDTYQGLGQLVGAVPQSDVDESRRLDAALMNTGAGLAGNVVGTIGQTVLPAAGLAKIASKLPLIAQGAAVGAGFDALQPVATGERRDTNALLGGLGGGAGTAVGQGVAALGRAAATTATPLVSELADKAKAMGIKLRASQVSNSMGTGLLTNLFDLLPFSGARKMGEAQKDQFTKALAKTVGVDDPVNALDVLTRAKPELGAKFNKLNNGNDVQIDPWHVDELGAHIDDFKASGIDPDKAAAAKRLIAIRQGILNNTDNNGVISGPAYQQMRTELGGIANSGEGTQAYRNTVDAMKGTLDKAFDAGLSPEDRALKDTLRQQWSNMKILENAAPSTPGADFDYKKLSAAINSRRNDNKANRSAMMYGTGDQTMPDLARIGDQFISSSAKGSPSLAGDKLIQLGKSAISPAGAATSIYGLNKLHEDENGSPALKSALELGALGLLAHGGTRALGSKFMLEGSPLVEGLGKSLLFGNQAGTGALNALKDAVPLPSGFSENPTGNGIPYMEINGTGNGQ